MCDIYPAKRKYQCRAWLCENDAEAYWRFKGGYQIRSHMRCRDHKPKGKWMIDLWTGLCEDCFTGYKGANAQCYRLCKNYKEGTTMYQEGQSTDEVVAKSVHDAEVASLNERITRLRNNYNALEQNIKEFRDALQEALSEEEIEEDVAKRFADIFNFDLTTEEEFTVTATYTVTIELPLGKSRSDVDESDFDFAIDYTGYGDMTASNEDSIEVS